MASVENKVVLITGGARGIGAGTATELVARGANVVLVDVDQPPLDALVASLPEGRAVGVLGDVTELASMEKAAAVAIETFGRIDVVVANAGIASYGSVLGVDPATFKRVIDINITGVFHTVRATLPAVIEQRGYVLVVSSLAAFAPAPGLAAYNASKAGVEHFANALRLETAHLGVQVGCAHMSWIDTPLVQDAREDLHAFDEMIASMPGPLSRTTSVEECVQAFADGIEKRRRHIYVPGWVGAIASGRGLVTSPLGSRATLKEVPRLLPMLDAEVRKLGRSTSARNQ
ncbi:SDR family oxidoreductase [Marmoricola sp. RAF53]|uniref:SDR family oxidoreductase n=1 Tax=Marmoricola sp. RAF53 TaxID=3233059 RepID=UPI003F9A16F3